MNPAIQTTNTCTNCEKTIRTDEWHPVKTDNDDRIRAFCSEECQNAWTAGTPADD